MRIYFYLLSGITSALMGWNIAQFFLDDLNLLRQSPEIILFPCTAISLAIGIVINEIFINNPTRLKIAKKKALISLPIATGLGLIMGLIAGIVAQILVLPQINLPAVIVRTLGWLIIGIAVGLAEGLTWRWQSVEAGSNKRFWQRLIIGVIGSSFGSLIAAVIFELIRTQNNLPLWLIEFEDPLGLAILGLLLGLTFSITNSPSYLGALRAGSGFEYTGEIYDNLELVYPSIDTNLLQFLPTITENEEIQEGLSIQLPAKGTIIIGSTNNEKAHIRLPKVADKIAEIKLEGYQARLKAEGYNLGAITINGASIDSSNSVILKHNNIITIYQQDENNQKINTQKFYRFVYYNRYLDPQA